MGLYFLLVGVFSVFILFIRGILIGKLTFNFIYSILVLSLFLGIYLNRFIFDVGYPIERGIVYIFILFIFSFYLLLDSIYYLNLRNKKKEILNFIGLSIPAYFIIQLLMSFNVSFAPLWKDSTFHKQFFSKIDKNRLPLVYAYPPMFYSYNFYNLMNEKNINLAQENVQVSSIADYVILNGYNKKYISTYNKKEYTIIDSMPETGVKLLKRNNFINWELEDELIISDTSFTAEFLNLVDIQLEGKTNYSMKNAVLSSTLQFNKKKNVWIVFALTNEKNKEMLYHSIKINEVYNFQTLFEKAQFFEKIPEGYDHFSVYIWNIDKTLVKVNQFSLKTFYSKYYGNYK